MATVRPPNQIVETLSDHEERDCLDAFLRHTEDALRNAHRTWLPVGMILTTEFDATVRASPHFHIGISEKLAERGEWRHRTRLRKLLRSQLAKTYPGFRELPATIQDKCVRFSRSGEVGPRGVGPYIAKDRNRRRGRPHSNAKKIPERLKPITRKLWFCVGMPRESGDSAKAARRLARLARKHSLAADEKLQRAGNFFSGNAVDSRGTPLSTSESTEPAKAEDDSLAESYIDTSKCYDSPWQDDCQAHQRDD